MKLALLEVIPGLTAMAYERARMNLHICKYSWMIAYLLKVHVLNLCKLFSRLYLPTPQGFVLPPVPPPHGDGSTEGELLTLRAVCASANEEPWQGQTLGTSRVPVSSFVFQAPSNSTSHRSPSPAVSFPLTVSSKFLFL